MRKARSLLFAAAFVAGASAQTPATTAWQHGRFHIDTAAVIHRSDIVLERPNTDASQAMPLGNGHLGAAVWSAEGLTAQLNRADTLPDRLSPGQIVVPGLSVLTGAPDYSGRLSLYDGEIQEKGGGMTATIWIEDATDTLVIDVTGADPGKLQTAQLRLWAPRTPHAAAQGATALLEQSWTDMGDPGASGRRFGALAAITADGRQTTASVTNDRTVTVSFKPLADGHFRVLVGAPHFSGQQDAFVIAHSALAASAPAAHRLWWHAYWNRAATIKLSSSDGVADYMENLRDIYLFAAAAERGDEYPGTQAGVADMLSSARDIHRWDSAAYWHWNLRMQVAANIGAGVPDLNLPYFNLYREDLPAIEDWTRDHMAGRPGICVPETMRFNGPGIEYERDWQSGNLAHDCDAKWSLYYNARTLSTGAEVSLWIWQQYLATGDRAFLARNYPVIAASARFLLAYQQPGADGLLHTSPSNAHETQWDVTDPTTDISAATALYPVAIEAAKLLGQDADLIRQIQAALLKIPPFPRTQLTGTRTLLPASADENAEDMIAESYEPGAKNHNGENIGLEPMWPYDLIGDTSPLFALARRTYDNRLFKAVADWSFDPIQAARLHLGAEVGSTLLRITESTQHSVNGFANWDKQYGEFYVEESGIVADALQEALVQDYDGLIRIAPAIPPGWDVDGSVFVRGRTKIDVQVRNGAVTTAVIEAGTTQPLAVRSPWPGQPVDILSGAGTKIVKADRSSVLHFHAVAGTSYLLAPSRPLAQPSYAPVNSIPAQTPKRLGPVQIGIFKGDAASQAQ
jgi:alpha-L-fucosidase 2